MSRTRSILASVTVAALVVPLTLRARDEQTAYRSEPYGFAFSPPDFDDDGEAPSVTIATFQAPPVDGFSANVNIQRQAFTGDMQAYVEMSEAQIEAIHLEVQASKSAQLGKREAHEWIYTGEMSGRALKFHALAVDDGDHVLLVTCTAAAKRFDDYASQFDAALASLKFED